MILVYELIGDMKTVPRRTRDMCVKLTSTENMVYRPRSADLPICICQVICLTGLSISIYLADSLGPSGRLSAGTELSKRLADRGHSTFYCY